MVNYSVVNSLFIPCIDNKNSPLDCSVWQFVKFLGVIVCV